jgi:hypothetical protein
MAGAGLFREKSTAAWWLITQTNRATIAIATATATNYILYDCVSHLFTPSVRRLLSADR